MFIECLLHCLLNIRDAFLCHNLRLHKLKNRGIACVKRSSFCFMCSISMPYLLIKTPSPLWDQEILTYIRKCLGSVPAWAVVHKCPVCVDLLLVGRRSERLCRRLVSILLLCIIYPREIKSYLSYLSITVSSKGESLIGSAWMEQNVLANFNTNKTSNETIGTCMLFIISSIEKRIQYFLNKKLLP